MEEKKNIAEQIKDVFRANFGYISVVFISLAYLSTSFLTIVSTGKSVFQIIYDGLMTFIIGMLMNRVFEAQGIINGDADPRVISAVNKHADMVEVVASRFDELDLWCDGKNAEALARARRIYLSSYGMRYYDYFASDGTPLPFVPTDCGWNRLGANARKERKRRRIYDHAVNMKITELSAGLLFSDTGNPNDPYYLGRSRPDYSAQSVRMDVRSKALLAIIFGYYGLSLLHSFSWANLLWIVFQLAIFLLMGALKMEQSNIYVVDEYRSRINKKTSILKMFVGAEKEVKEDEEDGKDIES